MEKITNVGSRLHNPVVGGALTGADEIKDDTKGKMQNVINQETDAELVRLDGAKQEKLTFDQTPTEGSTNPVTSGGVYAADAALQQAIEAILLLIPSAASALNQLADKSFVNSSISTATATFRGTYNLVTDLELTVSATHQQIATTLASVVSTADNNDYCFVQIPVSDQSTDIRVTERYKFNGTSWSYEYDLNNSGFTADQWAAINSGITSVLVSKLGALPTTAELAVMFAGKQNTLTFDSTPVAGSDNPVKSSGLYNAFAVINAMIPEGADANNKLVAESRLVAYVTTLINALDATFDVTSADGHVKLRMTQDDGVITSVQILTSDIASASALTTLAGRVSTAESDIDALQDAYAALTQSDVVIVNGALPSSGQQQNIIYRQPDQDHTPPQFYSDYMWNGTTWVLMATYNNAIDPHPKKGSQNLVTSGGVFDNMGALDVSELNATENPHTLATYADLSAALAAIPSDYQKGGMSIKFIQGTAPSSDNKYVQYRLMADEFTTDTTQWAICDNSVLVECPEYVAVYTDADGKIILAVENNGNIHFGAGVPQQVIDYINEKIAELSLDEYEYIVTFLGTLINGDKTLTELLDEKVDKVEGKSLIDEDVANGASYVENPEFINVELDADGNIIKATKNDGTEYFGVGIDIAGVSVEYSVENPEYIGVFLTGNNRILMAFENDGNVYYGIGVPKQIKDYVDSEIGSLNGDIIAIQTFLAGIDTTTLLGYLNDTYGELVDSPEFMEVELDANKKILGGRKSDGTKFEEVGYETPNISIDGINLITVDDPENRMDLGLDNGKKIVYYRDEAGVLHENVGVETNSLRLTPEGMTEFQQALKNSGFRPGGAGDWSDYVSQDGDYPLNIPIPKCAMLNIISDFDLTDIHKVGKPGAIEGVNYDIPTQVEFYDMSGNYFKKWATMSAQGNSSYAFMKKNLAFDFYDTEANGDAFAFKFGNWVAQDSYHLKAYYTDGFRGINIVNYTLYEQIINTRSADENREFKKHIPHIDTFSDGTESEEYNSVLNNYDAEARCFPDGFPVVVYQNGVFWGIFAWQLKKHRKNYHLDKKTATHIHLDGNVGTTNLFLVNGKATAIGWDATSDAGFEIRNPKADSKPSKSYLFLQADGSCYDADLNAGEILGKYLDDAEGYPDPEQPNPYYDNSNKNHKVCNNVKNNILKLSTYIPELKEMENDSATAEQIKARFEQMFDVDNLIDYIVFSAFIGNTDGFAKNWQWVTWDGNIWTVNPYDCDLTYGSNEGRGHILSGPGTDAIQKSKNKNNPCGWIWAYYPTELKARYKYLRDSGILSSDNVINILNSWISRFNIGDWEREFEKWSETPAHRPSYLNTEYWEFVRSAYGQSATYNENTSYNVGDEVVWMGHNLYDNRIACKYRCVKAHTAYDDPEHDIKKSDFYPCYKQYNNWPQIMGHYDSPSRVKYWIDQTLATQVDAEFDYI